LTAYFISCHNCISRNSVGGRRSSISTLAICEGNARPDWIAFYLHDQTRQQVVCRNLNIQQ
jgi:hypothetical protein